MNHRTSKLIFVSLAVSNGVVPDCADVSAEIRQIGERQIEQADSVYDEASSRTS